MQRWVLAGGLLLLVAWGARLTVLEGLVYEWPRHFNGDFAAAMFDPATWDHRGIFYGPLFVVEAWLSQTWPQIFSLQAYALADLVLAAGAFVLCVLAADLRGLAILGALAIWLDFNRFYYSISVAANPEFLELTLLSGAWLLASRRRAIGEAALITLAALVKLFPGIFLLQLLIRGHVRQLLTMALVSLPVVALVGIGQGMTPWALARAIVMPTGSAGQAVFFVPELGDQFLGVNSAIARLLRVVGVDLTALGPTIIIATALVVLAGLGLAAWAVWRLDRNPGGLSWPATIALTYALFFTLLPLVTLRAHIHTYLFLLPVWTALLAVLLEERRPVVRLAAGAFFVACYIYLGYGIRGLWLDPVWGTLLVLAGLLVYVRLRPSAVTSPPLPAHQLPSDAARRYPLPPGFAG